MASLKQKMSVLWEYECNLSKKAFRNTLTALAASPRRILFEIFVYVAGAGIYLWLQGWEAVTQEVVITLAYVFLPLFLIGLALYGYYRTSAPVELTQELEDRERGVVQERERIAAELAKLQQDILPRVDVIFLPRQRPFEETEPLNSQGHVRRRTFSVGIRNTGNEMLHHVSVKLSNVSPPSAYVPINLKLREERPYPTTYLNYDFEQEFQLSPQEVKYVDVAFLDETNPQSEIELCYATEGHKNGHIARTVARGDYILFIDVFAENGNPVNTQFDLNVEDGYLRLRRMA